MEIGMGCHKMFVTLKSGIKRIVDTTEQVRAKVRVKRGIPCCRKGGKPNTNGLNIQRRTGGSATGRQKIAADLPDPVNHPTMGHLELTFSNILDLSKHHARQRVTR